MNIYSEADFQNKLDKKIIERVKKVKLIIADVDGVLTDGSIYKGGNDSSENFELKKFSVLDGAGVALARLLGFHIAIISGRESYATKIRANELKLKYSLLDENCAFIGDDIIDISLMETVGVPIAVANAYHLVKKKAIYTTLLSGGHGAFREAVDWLAICQGRYEDGIQLMMDSLLSK